MGVGFVKVQTISVVSAVKDIKLKISIIEIKQNPFHTHTLQRFLTRTILKEGDT